VRAPQAARIELIDELVRRLEAKFGPGIVYRLSRARPKIGALAVSSGSLALDRATGIGGVPRGRLALLRGGPSSGKTTLAYHLLAEAQRDGGLAALIDGEGAADETALLACGVDLDDLILASPRDAVEALEMLEILVRCRALDAVVASALPPAGPGLLDRGLRRLNTWLRGAPTAVVVVGEGQARGTARPGGSPRPAGSPGPAGPVLPQALAFFASLIVDFEAPRPLFGPGGDIAGLEVRAVVSKNRLAAPDGAAELEIASGRGLRRASELLSLGLELDQISRTAQGLIWEPGRAGRRVLLGRGPAAALACIEADPRLAAALERAIRQALERDRPTVKRCALPSGVPHD
jgi:recombination protein RecA